MSCCKKLFVPDYLESLLSSYVASLQCFWRPIFFFGMADFHDDAGISERFFQGCIFFVSPVPIVVAMHWWAQVCNVFVPVYVV